MKKYKGPIWPGKPYPMGATVDGRGVNFALFSETATSVQLCLFKSVDHTDDYQVVEVTEKTHQVWHVYLPGIEPGQLYGYRVGGIHQPEEGLRFNPNKLLIDPYAKAIAGEVQWHESMYGYPVKSEEEDRDLQKDTQDNAAYAPKSVVVDTTFNWNRDRRPRVPLHKSIIYEAHVKGFTMQHPKIDPSIRGTYKALTKPVVIKHLQKMGVTAIELMPVHHFIQDEFLINKGLSNYWGYNSIGYFAPHASYSSSGHLGGQVTEFKEMVRAMHKAGIEVILDVVYNHTAEGNHYGPTLSFKGIDNPAYYRLVQEQKRYYMDYTGTGNSLNMVHPHTLQLVMDSLRYWIEEMHIDGYRFDLAATLARGLQEVGKLSAFLETIHQDPIISQVKLIAEPWDVGEGGYQVGNFPVLWSEWNGKYRDSVRSFWKGDEIPFIDISNRLTGSSDLYELGGRKPSASVNFITAHDGFTLNDLVSYNEKHNEANKDNNQDGDNHNNSWNCGAEGPTDDPEVNQLRERQKRNFLATMMLSLGVPMISHGDEYGRTQHGNNNVYCQDNELSWYDWEWDKTQKNLFKFFLRIIQLRLESPVLNRRKFLYGHIIHGKDAPDVRWIKPEGEDISDEEWDTSCFLTFGMLLNGQAMEEYNPKGELIKGNILLAIFNSYWESVTFKLPSIRDKHLWDLVFDTFETNSFKNEDEVKEGVIEIRPRSIVLLKQKYT